MQLGVVSVPPSPTPGTYGLVGYGVGVRYSSGQRTTVRTVRIGLVTVGENHHNFSRNCAAISAKQLQASLLHSKTNISSRKSAGTKSCIDLRSQHYGIISKILYLAIQYTTFAARRVRRKSCRYISIAFITAAERYERDLCV